MLLLATTIDHMQYFKSIETVEAEQSDLTETATPLPATTDKVNSWRGALKELKIDTDKKAAAEDGELTPDNMSSRLDDSAIGMSPPQKAEEFEAPSFDRMGSRVNTLAA